MPVFTFENGQFVTSETLNTTMQKLLFPVLGDKPKKEGKASSGAKQQHQKPFDHRIALGICFA
jgi:hypothetical protein